MEEFNISETFGYSIPVNTKIAVALGLNEAIIISQIIYWMNINRNDPKHIFDNRVWIYNSYEEWRDSNFPYLSTSTIRRALSNLEKQGIVLTKRLNRKGYDRTKWYTVDTDKLSTIVLSAQNEQADCSNWAGNVFKMNTHTVQNEQTNTLKYSESSSYTSPENNNIGVQGRVPEKPKHNAGDIPFDFNVVERQFRKACKELETENVDDVLYVVKKFYQCWFRNFGWSGEPPRRLSQREVEQCVRSMWEYEDDSGCIEYIELWEYDELIERYFEIDFTDCDYSLTHFLFGKIRQYRLYETAL